MLVTLSTGRNNILKTSIKLSAPSGIHFKYSEAVLDSVGETTSPVDLVAEINIRN